MMFTLHHLHPLHPQGFLNLYFQWKLFPFNFSVLWFSIFSPDAAKAWTVNKTLSHHAISDARRRKAALVIFPQVIWIEIKTHSIEHACLSFSFYIQLISDTRRGLTERFFFSFAKLSGMKQEAKFVLSSKRTSENLSDYSWGCVLSSSSSSQPSFHSLEAFFCSTKSEQTCVRMCLRRGNCGGGKRKKEDFQQDTLSLSSFWKWRFPFFLSTSRKKKQHRQCEEKLHIKAFSVIYVYQVKRREACQNIIHEPNTGGLEMKKRARY